MEERLRRMARLFAALLCLCMAGTAAHAMGEARVFAYGASGDALTDIAAGADGRLLMTGYADSTGGAKGERAGWALCVDASGRALWSFRTGRAAACELTHPVLREDGSAQALLYEEEDGEERACLIDLSAEGEETAREPLAQGRAEWLRREAREPALSIEWPEGEDLRVLRRADDGTYRPFATVPDSAYRAGGQMRFCACDLILLPDGGLAASGWRQADGEPHVGRLLRWDAQGRLAFDVRVPGWELGALLQTEGGFVSLARASTRGDQPASDSPERRLIFFDERGAVSGEARMPRAPFERLAALPDGTLAVLCADPYASAHSDAPRLVLLDPGGSETAVPAPEAAREAAFYVNPDGGRYYHTASDCPAVDKAYTPLTPMTPQAIREAGRYGPCSVCGAWAL